MKRVLDIAISLFMLVMLSPVLVVIAICIQLDSMGPVIYKQKRVGRYGSTFSILKFRSMVHDADQLGGYSTLRNDSRITVLGRFLRKSSLDELPQFINVLIGDMSIIGPRPDVPEQKQNYTDEEWEKRNSVRPGITGLAQATVRSDATQEERIKLDLEYVERVSLWFDIKILFLTARQLLSRGSF